MKSRIRPAWWLLGAALASPLAAAQVTLRTAPNDGSPAVAKVEATDPAVRSGTPALGVEGWLWTEYATTVDGFVPAAQVGKNFAIDPGTPVHDEADSGAPVLTRIQPGDRVEVVAADGTWVEIRFEQAVPVYFRKPAGGARRAAGPGGSPAARAVEVEPAAPEPADPAPAGSVVVTEAEASTAQPPRKPKPPAGTPMRVMSGTLVRESGSSSGPRFTLSLRSGNARLAYVDISRLFVRDLRPYLDNQVIVMGELSSISPGGTELVIHARTLRIKP